MHDRRRGLTLTVLLLIGALLAAGCTSGSSDRGAETSTTTTTSRDGGTDPSDPTDPGTEDPVADTTRIEVLSSQPDRITGDDARIRITPSSGGSVGDLRVEIDGRDVTGRFTAADGHLEGVVDGLVEGTNTLTVNGDGEPATLRLRSWPLQGPMISGPQTPLLVCSTLGNGLGSPTGPTTCAAPTVVTFRYITKAGKVAELPDRAATPADAAMITVDGSDHPAVLRVERGVLNRSVYEIVIPATDPSSDPEAPVSPVWNGRLVYRFGDGCGATFGQGTLDGGAIDAALAAKGYAVATATFNDGAVQCNDVVSAETTMMVKERVVELVGVPDATIGEGTGLGGGQVHLLTQNYPDVLDGGVTVDGFADLITFGNEMADCSLFREYFAGGGKSLTEAQRGAVMGYGSPATCTKILDRYGTPFDPTTGCDPEISTEKIWAADRPDGVRCTVPAIAKVPYGEDPATHEPFRPVDNVGVQYGLQALNNGTISVDEFIALNKAIGGLDGNGKRSPERSEADAFLVQRVYETGRVSAGTGDQGTVPFIDVVPASPSDEPGDAHRAVAFRDRLMRTARQADGQQIWAVADPAASRVTAIDTVADWLEAIAGKGSDALTDTRPEAAIGFCGSGADRVEGEDVWDRTDGECRDDLASDPRMVAGAPSAGDVIKCELKPVDSYDYEVDVTTEQLDQIEQIFPTGVCDWMMAGAGQTLPTMPDRSFDQTDTPASRV